MRNELKQAHAILNDAIVIDGLGGAVVHPTPYVVEGTYEEQLVSHGWTAMNATLVSEPAYTATFEETLSSVYENLLYLEMSPKLRLVETAVDIETAKTEGQLALILGTQSGNFIEQDRKRVRLMHKLGLRMLQLTYMERNFIGDGCLEPGNHGLTHFGIQVVRDCNRVGMLVDCSHGGIRTTIDAAEFSKDPIVISHTAIRAITDNPRCVTDEQMKAVAAGGGVVGITPYSPFIKSDGVPTVDHYIDHIDYAIQLIGPEHVSFATDMFDGKTKVNWATPWYYPEIARNATYVTRRIEGFSKKHQLPDFVAHLIKRGYDEKTVRGVLGLNLLNVMKKVWK